MPPSITGAPLMSLIRLRALAPPAGDRRAPDGQPVARQHAQHLARGEGQDRELAVGRQAGAAEQPGAAGALHPPERPPVPASSA